MDENIKGVRVSNTDEVTAPKSEVDKTSKNDLIGSNEQYKMWISISQKSLEWINEVWTNIEHLSFDDTITAEERQKLLKSGSDICSRLLGLHQTIIQLAELNSPDTTLNLESKPISELMSTVELIFNDRLEVEMEGGDKVNVTCITPEYPCQTCQTSIDEDRLTEALYSALMGLARHNEVTSVEYGYEPITVEGKSYCRCFFNAKGLTLTQKRVGRVFFPAMYDDEPVDFNRLLARIGLTTLNGVIELLGGFNDIKQESELTIFSLYLPCL